MTRKEQKDARIGETRIMHNGMEATIIEYRSATDIDVQFNDGAILSNRTYDNFKHGKISHPDKKKLKFVTYLPDE